MRVCEYPESSMGVKGPGSIRRPTWLSPVRGWDQGHQAPIKQAAKVRSLISF